MLEDRQPAVPEEPPSPVELPDTTAPAEPDAATAAVPSPGGAQGRLGRFVAHRRQWLASEQVRMQTELETRRQRSGMVDAGFLVQELDARVEGGILVLIGITLLASALGIAVNDVRNASGAAGAVIAVLLVTALSFAGWWWVSWKLPHAPCPARALIPGALLMAVGAAVLQLLTTYWIGHLVAWKTSTYGAVGIALAVLLWVYILGPIMVGSAGLNAALWYRRENR